MLPPRVLCEQELHINFEAQIVQQLLPFILLLTTAIQSKQLASATSAIDQKNTVLRGVVCTNKLETVAEVKAPESYALVTGAGCYDSRIT